MGVGYTEEVEEVEEVEWVYTSEYVFIFILICPGLHIFRSTHMHICMTLPTWHHLALAEAVKILAAAVLSLFKGGEYSGDSKREGSAPTWYPNSYQS